ncbi:RHS repeat-containing protein [Desulfonema limicola]|uniref:RHS repeat-containing protein n=1 Tax=Desulfonema limicola TaxID=45656 RepID=A0A975GFL0_9BACT|nr:RHS repeat-associated core domain-containing protein [Desulfonema limicola]QTA79406.1 RHS repeat-containing protein [Desulfonema limicola]
MLKKNLILNIKIFILFMVTVFALNTYYIPVVHAFDQDWDGGHQGTDPGNPPPSNDEEGDDGCKEPPCDECKASGSPVVFIDGSYHTQFTDMTLPGVPGIALKRYYRSQHSFRTGFFGYGWSFAYEMRVQEVAGIPKYASVLMPNAQVYKFIDNGNGSYITPDGTTLVLKKNESDRFELSEPNGNTYRFNEDNRLSEVIDKNGNNITLTYENGCIASVSAPDGRILTFTKGPNGKIASVSDHTGRTVQYGYDDNGNLTSFTNINGDTQVIAYNDHWITSVSDFMGNTITSVTYDYEGKVLSLTDNGLTYTYEYPGGNIVRRTDIDGTWQFTFNDAGLVTSVKDPFGNTTAKVFDANGNLTAQTDAMGNTTTYTYDSLGNILTVTDPLGNVTTYTYYPGTKLVETETGPNGIITKYEYDENGNIVKIYRAFGTPEQTIIQNLYDDSGNLTSFTDPNGNTSVFDYDNAGRLISESKDGLTVSYEYDDSGNLSKKTYPWGGIQEFTYDSEGRKLTEKDPEGNITKYTYDANGNLITITDSLGNVTTNEYDDFGRITKVIDAAGGTKEFTRDQKGRPVSVKDRNGVVQNITYNHLGLATRVVTGTRSQLFEYDANGNTISKTDPEGNKTSSEYDALSRLSKKTSPDGTQAVYTYDKNSKLLSVNFPGPDISINRSYDKYGRELTVSDSLGDIGTSKTYDNNGNILTETDVDGNNIVCEYDAFNRIVKKTFMDGTWQTYQYNNKGVIDKITSSNGAVTTFVHDNNGRIVSSADMRGTYSVTYDAAGNIASRTDPNKNTTSYEYDKLNRVVRETYPDGSTKSFTYKPEGEMASVNDRNGNTIQYEYNDMGLMTKRDYPGDNDDVFTYNARGQVISAVNQDAEVSYEYDKDGRITKETLNGKTVSYNYDLDNKQTKITYPGGRVVARKYDVRGRLEKLSDSGGDIASFSYNLNDELVKTTYQNGAVIDYTYANTKPVSMTHQVNGNNILGYDLKYNAQGKLEKETRTDNAARDKAYAYDNVGRLVKATYGTPSAVEDNYTLDGVDNWQQWNGQTRTINNLNQYTAIDGIAYKYDKNGNLLEDDRNRYEYDYMNRIIKVTRKSDNKIIEYKYDAVGRRIARVSGGITTSYFYDRMFHVIEEQVNDVTTVTYIVGESFKIYTMQKNGQTYYYHQDIRGNVVKITDSSGNIIEEYKYDAYGNATIYDNTGAIISASLIGNNYGFTGTLFDSDTQLNYMLNRYYSPNLGRFMSKDPAGYVDGGNLYLYAKSDPINNVDFSGLSAEDCLKTQDIQWSADKNIWEVLKKMRLGEIRTASAGVGAGLTLSLSACNKDCCKDGKTTNLNYMKGSLTVEFSLSGSAPIPGWGIDIPKIGQLGFFFTAGISLSGGGSYAPLIKDCKIEHRANATLCGALGGSIGIKGGASASEYAEAWVKGSVGLKGKVCYDFGVKEWNYDICGSAGVSIEVSVEIAWWKYGNTFNVLSGEICYGSRGTSGSIQFLNYERNYG